VHRKPARKGFDALHALRCQPGGGVLLDVQSVILSRRRSPTMSEDARTLSMRGAQIWRRVSMLAQASPTDASSENKRMNYDAAEHGNSEPWRIVFCCTSAFADALIAGARAQVKRVCGPRPTRPVGDAPAVPTTFGQRPFPILSRNPVSSGGVGADEVSFTSKRRVHRHHVPESLLAAGARFYCS